MVWVRTLRPEPSGLAGLIPTGAILAAAMLAPIVLPAYAIDCTCRFGGENFQLGDIVCLKGPDGPRLAQCDMMLNNTSWRPLSEGCPVGQLPLGTIEEIDGGDAPSSGAFLAASQPR